MIVSFSLATICFFLTFLLSSYCLNISLKKNIFSFWYIHILFYIVSVSLALYSPSVETCLLLPLFYSMVVTDIYERMVYTLPCVCLSILAMLIGPLSLCKSLCGALGGLLLIVLIRKVWFFLKKEEGMGLGDGYVLMAVGACSGLEGVFFSIACASIIGSFYGLVYSYVYKHHLSKVQVSFVPFLYIGYIVFRFLYYRNI